MLQSRSDYSPIPSEPQEPTSNGLPALSSQKRTMVMAGWVAVAMVLLIFVVTNTANDAAADVSVMQSTIFEPTAEPTSFWEKYIPTEEHLPEPSTVPTAGWMGNDHRRKDPFPTPVYPPSSPVQPWYSSVYGSKYPGTPTLAPVAMPSDPAGKNKLDPAPLVQEEAESEPWWAKFVPPSMRPKIPVLNPTQPPTTDADSQPSLEPTAGPGKDGEDEDKDHDKKKHHHHKKHHKHDDDDDSGSSEDKEDEKEPSSEGDNDETGPAAGEVPPAEPVESNSFVVIASEPKNGDPWWMQFVPSQFRSKVRKDLTMQPTTSPVAAPVPVPVNPPPVIVEPPAVPAEPVPLTLTPTVATTPAPGKEDKDHKKEDKKEDKKHDEDDKKSDKKEKDKKKEKKHHKHDDDDDSAGSDDDSASSEKEPRHKDEKEKEDKKGKEEIVVEHKHEDGDSSEEDKKGKEELVVEHKHKDGDSSEEGHKAEKKDKKGKDEVVVEHKHEGK